MAPECARIPASNLNKESNRFTAILTPDTFIATLCSHAGSSFLAVVLLFVLSDIAVMFNFFVCSIKQDLLNFLFKYISFCTFLYLSLQVLLMSHTLRHSQKTYFLSVTYQSAVLQGSFCVPELHLSQKILLKETLSKRKSLQNIFSRKQKDTPAEHTLSHRYV